MPRRIIYQKYCSGRPSFGIERSHLLPVIGLARHTSRTLHCMEAFEEKALLRNAPGGLILSVYNAAVIVLIAAVLMTVM